MSPSESRRPLKVREARLAQSFACWLSRRRITPNQISLASIVFALLAAGCMLATRAASPGWSAVLWVLAAACVQGRLLCNLFDGMVAVEGGRRTRSGELFNDLPDRISDPLILVAAGYATTVVPWAAGLGWAAALGAVLTAYVRTLTASCGAPMDFRGPMAKQQRMALMTAACLLSALEPLWWRPGWAMLVALGLIAAGCAITAARRARAAYLALERGADV